MSAMLARSCSLFDDVNGDNKTSKEDITDEVLQRYYSNILDNSAPNAPQD